MDKKKKILLVEDEAVAASFLRIILSGKYELDIAKDGNSGYEKAISKYYDVMILDINLGKGITGIELCKLLRVREEMKDKPIIAVTAYAMESEKQIILNSGFTDYLSKPYTKKEMLDMLTKYSE